MAFSKSKGYTGLNSRIVSTRSDGLEKLGASTPKAVRKNHNIEEEALALQTKRSRSLSLQHELTVNPISSKRVPSRRSHFYKKLLKVYHKGMGDAAAMPLPDEDDKN
ncbi:hypothetical protein BPOR_0463g00080 [Botrytis porri]|uniref:Uncharacterized protein n=1 Tax=Botrytis porri TaxID=87229 RepID=A0A4Z1KGY3_9HELO|nr:hypothetical protein BPOR_0463g00080 [Botrytis porri]